MKKMLIKCFTNIVLFILFGLSFAFPFKQFEVISDYGLEVTFSIFPILLLGYIVLYLIIYSLLKTMKIIPESDTSELYYEDEQEKRNCREGYKEFLCYFDGWLNSYDRHIKSLANIFCCFKF